MPLRTVQPICSASTKQRHFRCVIERSAIADIAPSCATDNIRVKTKNFHTGGMMWTFKGWQLPSQPAKMHPGLQYLLSMYILG